jgi:glyceraldehyde-3-phosphate dehydrogenase type II
MTGPDRPVVVRVRGEGLRGLWLRQAVAKQADCVLAGPDSPEAMVHVWEDEPGPPPLIQNESTRVVVVGAYPEAAIFHSAWNYHEVAGKTCVYIPALPVTIVLRILACIPQARHVHVTTLAPAGLPARALHGPIDSLTPLPMDGGLEVSLLPATTWSEQSVVTPHTRCWLMGCMVETHTELVAQHVLRALTEAPRVMLTPPEIAFPDTAVVREFFRDLGDPHGLFTEAVVFTDSLVVTRQRMTLWVAASEVGIIPETIDGIRAVLGQTPATASIQQTDQALGIRRSFRPACHITEEA